MTSEIELIIQRISTVNEGDPWFGRASYKILSETDSKKSALVPNGSGHSCIQLLYHMITWSDFTLYRINKDRINDLAAAEELDWRLIDPAIHSWKKGLAEFKTSQQNIINRLSEKEDSFLDEIVDYRKYNFRFLINGMIEHTIYHTGQIAYINKIV